MDNFLSRNPFVRFLLPLVAGILAGNYWELPIWVSVLFIVCASVFFIGHLCVFRKPYFYKYRWFFGCAVSLLFILAGWWLIRQSYARTEVPFLDKQGVYQVLVTDMPEEKPRSVLCRVSVQSMPDNMPVVHNQGDAILYIGKDTNSLAIKRNDILFVSCLFSAPRSNGNPESFNYADYLRKQGIAATAYVPSGKWKICGHDSTFSILEWAQKCQHYLLNVYKKYGIEKDEFAVLAALTLGYKDSLEPEIQQDFAATGAMHILAVSGLHVGVIFIVLNFIFSLLFDRFPKTKVPKTILIIVCLWAYAFITGLSPSVLRASIMFSFIRIGMSLEQKSQIYNTIALSAFLLLVYNPLLLFSVGFQLSYSAVVAIVFYQPKMVRWVYFKWKPLRWLWDLLCVSVAAQIGTAPWTLLYFHQFSNYFLLTNIVAIPAASIIIYTAVFLLVVSPLNGLAQIIAFVLNKEVWALNMSIKAIGQIPHSVSQIWISEWQAVLAFVIIITMTLYVYRKKIPWLWVSMSCILLFIAQSILLQYTTLTTEKLLVYNDSRVTIVQQTEGKKNRIYANNIDKITQLTSSYELKYRLNKPQVQIMDTLFHSCFLFDNKRFLVLDNEVLYRRKAKQNLQVDYLLIGNIGKTRLPDIFTQINVSNIIALGSFPFWKKEDLKKLCSDKNISYFDVAETGAFVLSCSDHYR